MFSDLIYFSFFFSLLFGKPSPLTEAAIMWYVWEVYANMTLTCIGSSVV